MPSEVYQYKPCGSAAEAFRSTDTEVLLCGPAGTGKTRAWLESVYYVAERYPGSRQLICRKTRVSMSESVLATWEDSVLIPGHPCIGAATRAHRSTYQFPNGSIVALGGLDRPTRLYSSEWDRVYVPEATELEESEWESLLRSLRAGNLPYQQLIADCNPDSSSHWLNQRCNSGATRRIIGRFEDNPRFWDDSKGDWTQEGKDYIARLDKLTGVRLQRLRYGLWVAAEGMIYDTWDMSTNAVDRFDPPQDWRRVWSVDFGYTNPFVWQSWAVDPDGRMFLHREIYQSQRLVEDLSKMVIEASAGDPRPEAIVCDHDAEGRATFERHTGLRTVPAFKDVAGGIQAVQERVRPAGDEKPRIYIMRDARAHPADSELTVRRLPTCTLEEVEGYVWAVDRVTKKPKHDEPVKENDHGMDCLRYAVAYVDMLDKKPKTKSPGQPKPATRITYQTV